MAPALPPFPLQRERPKLPESTPWPLQRLIRKCWSDEPFKRPSAHEVARALQFMLEDHISRGFPPSQFHDEVTPSSSEATDASKGSSDLQARTQVTPSVLRPSKPPPQKRVHVSFE